MAAANPLFTAATRVAMPDAPQPVGDRRLGRVEVRRVGASGDARSERLLQDLRQVPALATLESLSVAAVYLVEGPIDRTLLERIAGELLADPVTERSTVALEPSRDADGVAIEVHPLPGVTDPTGDSVRSAVRELFGVDTQVRTGWRYEFAGIDAAAARSIAATRLANPVIHAIHAGRFHPERFPEGRTRPGEVPEVRLRDLDEAGLQQLSREGHLFLSLEEMQSIQAHFRDLGREPRAIELETLAQTWSEHCVHKTLKSTVRYREASATDPSLLALAADGRPGHRVEADGSVLIDNLLRSTIAAATRRLIDEGIDWCLSVFVDNSGVVAFDETQAVCFKVETHNHPSAIEPYGGAATGIGGCIRDIIGTGLAAKPIAATDVFCVAPPELAPLPPGCLEPRRVLSEVVAGVRDYGNRMGIPTLNGAVWFDPRHVGNPLVFCGVVGLLPRHLVRGGAHAGDRIVALGGRTGRDGIHGATFSSAELTDAHADEFSHAVQIGHAVCEKTLLDAVLAARDVEGGPLYSAITDCGAGGFSSAIGEMGAELGAVVDLEKAPLKYAGLDPTEVWISEAQERVVLAVPAANLGRLAALCEAHETEWADLGVFGEPRRDLVLRWHGREVGRLSMEFLHEGVPMPLREAVWDPQAAAAEAEHGLAALRAAEAPPASHEPAGMLAILERLLAHPNIASKAWIVRQYDHEVQGRTVVKPIVGVREGGPSDAAVIEPVPGSGRGLAIANGLATGWEADPYLMGLAAIDECVRNLVCVGADPGRIAILDNFCWPGCGDPLRMAMLVRAAEACHDGAIAYRAPFISGKDSLNNQFAIEGGETIRIPPTLLISGFAVVPDLDRAVTMDAKRAGNVLVLVGETHAALGGSHLLRVARIATNDGERAPDLSLPRVDLATGPAAAAAVHRAIAAGLVRSAHDPSEGGLLVAAAEMAFSGSLGVSVDLDAMEGPADALAAAFGETPSRYLLEVEHDRIEALRDVLGAVPWRVVGEFTSEAIFTLSCEGHGASCPMALLEEAWRSGAMP